MPCPACRGAAGDVKLGLQFAVRQRHHTENPLADPKHEESFRVIDRRMFNTEGEIRDEAVREERHKQELAPSPAPGPTAVPSPAGKSEAAPAATQPETPVDAPKPSRGLEMLINFVAQNAAMLLGAYPDPRTGQGMVDLEGAREMIDMLDALRESTRGNVAPDDERLLLDVLGSLKLSFMEMTKAAAKAMQEKAKARP
jgi:3-oxoacyl-ACP reductase-like protein